MFLATSVIILLLLICIKFFKQWNEKYCILSLCERFKTVDGSDLSTKLAVIPGKTVFGNNFDFLKTDSQESFEFLLYNIVNAEDAEEVFLSQALITKSVIYEIVRNFLGLGLLISTDQDWQFRRKILTPAFHFNILKNFMEVFKEESARFLKLVKDHDGQIFLLNEIISEFTLNSICETALGVKLSEVPGSKVYRKSVNELELLIVQRSRNPLMYNPMIYRLFGDRKKNMQLIGICHEFASHIIRKKREDFNQNKKDTKLKEESGAYGKNKRYAMLDTLLDAEQQGLIDHQGICDEVNTFMFGGYDTTSKSLMFCLLNLSAKADIQEKCYQEIKDLADMSELTVFDFNKLEYLECVIKETLRLYPPAPLIARQSMSETTLNGLVIPKGAQINVHIFDIMRDPRHFPDPEKFDPDRFLPENTTNRHPFAFVPFSAGPRNCIGQKFAMLEIKVMLVAILKNFKLFPVQPVQPEDVVFETGIILRSKFPIKIKMVARD